MHFCLRVELLQSEPLIWRRVWIDGASTLTQLHHVIQAAMGWESRHLHRFEIHGQRYQRPDEDDALSDEAIEDDAKWVLQDLLRTGLHFVYRYDFGDDWEHRVVVERTEPTTERLEVAMVAAGERACPPEDIGGIARYMTLIDRRFTGVTQRERQAFAERVGLDFDSERFDRHAANAALTRMAWNGWDRLPSS